jgi:hypothetical protein
MLRVLVHDALAAALLHGFDRISFHGFCIEARCLSASGADPACMALTLTADGGAELLDRVRIAVAFRSDPGSACRIDPLHALPVTARQTESLAGCVSPVDARYASPETGQIS